MTGKELRKWIQELDEKGKLYKFYKCKEWLELKQAVLSESHYECIKCREKGKISRAEEVHHVQWVKRHPELALSRTYQYKGKEYKNLLPLCHSCHDKEHERFGNEKRKQFNEERW